MCVGFLFAGPSLAILAVLFVLAGIYIGIVDAMERALAADLLPVEQRGVGYGVLATANSIGDLLSSIVVGYLWSHVSAASGFIFAAVLTIMGAIALFAIPEAIIKPEPVLDDSMARGD
jgi:MFS family permease